MSSTRRNPLYALVDCNSFYVACECVFNPKLVGKPVVVLSSNDGCIVARSKEAKSLGIPMGAPAFEYSEMFRNYNVTALSSNYTLYGNMSSRIMQILESFAPIQVYSIDEAFLSLDVPDAMSYCREIKRVVQKNTGLSISIGVGPSMTLAKVANDIAKNQPQYGSICSLASSQLQKDVLQHLPVENVWGIGRRIADYLRRQNIHTAEEFRLADDLWIKKNLSVVGLRMAWELRGIPCLSIEDAPAPKKSLTCSRSFSRAVSDIDELLEALSSYAAKATEKLREQESLASYIDVFLMTNKHQQSPYYVNQIQIILPQPSHYTPTIIHYAKEGLRRIYREGLLYKKTGLTLGGLVSMHGYQMDLFVDNNKNAHKEKNLMQVMDQINQRYKRPVLKIAAEGIQQTWKSKREKCSPHYTTSWKDILTIQI